MIIKYCNSRTFTSSSKTFKALFRLQKIFRVSEKWKLFLKDFQGSLDNCWEHVCSKYIWSVVTVDQYVYKWGLTQSPSCDCGQRQTMNHTVDSCQLTEFEGRLNLPHEADDDAVIWLEHSRNNKRVCICLVETVTEKHSLSTYRTINIEHTPV